MSAALDLNGVRILPGYLDAAAQAALLADLRGVARAAPPVAYETPGGRRMTVRMTAAGRFGWVSERAGYRYAETQPRGGPWPPIPPRLLALWAEVLPEARAPECCLLNWYGEGTRLGMHRDADEADLSQPVLSVSLGDDGQFRVGGVDRPAPSRSVWLRSGDLAVLEGSARLAYHGIDKIRFGSSSLLAQGGRLNVTLRVVS